MSMQKIELNPSADVIHVDEVDVSQGVYIRTPSGAILYVVDDLKTRVINAGTGIYKSFDTLKDIVGYHDDCEVLTLGTNRRIVLDKPVTVEDFTNASHVGVIDNDGIKGEIVNADGIKVIWNQQINLCNEYDKIGSNINELLVHDIEIRAVRLFTTRRELYAWLAE